MDKKKKNLKLTSATLRNSDIRVIRVRNFLYMSKPSLH